MQLNPTLFILSCSNSKEEGGVPSYNSKSSIVSLDSGLGRNIIKTRSAIMELLTDGSFDRNGIKLIDLEYNNSLRFGVDFGGKDKASYLVARKRYIGRLYSQILENVWENRQSHVLILSGLYGLVLPEEHIQLYSLNVKDNTIISDAWENELASILEMYVNKFDIETVIDLTGDNYYRNLIEWDKLSRNIAVYHAFGKQNKDPAVLSALGNFLNKAGLLLNKKDLEDILNDENGYKTKYERIVFATDLAKARKMGLLEEESIKKQEQKIVPFKKQPLELKEISTSTNVDFVLNFRVVEQILELPKHIQAKLYETITIYIKNQKHPSLGAEIIDKNGERFIRCRISDFYRVHFKPFDSKKSQLVIRAVGGHKLEGID